VAVLVNEVVDPGTHSWDIVPDSTTLQIVLYSGTAGGTSYVDNVSTKELEVIDGAVKADVISMDDGLGLKFPDGTVYVNMDSGAAGTDYPQGTATHPVNNMTNAWAIAQTNKLRKFSVTGIINPVEMADGEGDSSILVGVHSQVRIRTFLTGRRDGATFINLGLSRYDDDYEEYPTVLNCVIYYDFKIYGGIIKDSVVVGSKKIAPQASADVDICDTLFDSGRVNFADMTAGVCSIKNCKGTLNIDDLVAGDVTVNIYGFKGRLLIASSCVAGTINIYGFTGELVDISDGVTVNRYEDPTSLLATSASITALGVSVTSRNSLRQIAGEISGKPLSTLGVLLTVGGAPLATAGASVDIELMRESDGYREKKRVLMTKGTTDGFYMVRLKDYFSNLAANRIYSYCISSGETTIDSTTGTFRVTDSVTGTEILERVNNLQRYFDQQGKFKKKEMTNAAPQSKNA
jgi:hypothetical protein